MTLPTYRPQHDCSALLPPLITTTNLGKPSQATKFMTSGVVVTCPSCNRSYTSQAVIPTSGSAVMQWVNTAEPSTAATAVTVGVKLG